MFNGVKKLWNEEGKPMLEFAIFPVLAGLIAGLLVLLLQTTIKAIFNR